MLGPGDINALEDAVLCPTCGALARLSMTIEDRVAARLDAAAEGSPPPGCEIVRHDSAIKLVSRSSTRESRLFVLCSWFCVVIGFGLIGLAGAAIALYLGSPAPQWLRSFLGQTGALTINRQEVATLLGLAGAFSLMGGLLWGLQSTGHFGPIRIAASTTDISIHAGIGWLSLKRRFQVEQTRSISVGTSSVRVNGRLLPALIIQAEDRLELGALMPPTASAWLAGVLRRHLLAIRRPGGT